MRMDAASGPTAADILNQASESELPDLFWKYGQEKHSARISKNIVRFRQRAPILTTDHLVEIVKASTPPNYRVKSLSRIFQALRIQVNDELAALEKGLQTLFSLLSFRGRMVVISYHSLEDTLVKAFFRARSRGCTCPPEFPKCVCGKAPELRILTPKAIRPNVSECQSNPRARSAKLRAIEKIVS
jgi:16S rRNA (cytosine1402-N4)-methyltransferase